MSPDDVGGLAAGVLLSVKDAVSAKSPATNDPLYLKGAILW